MERTGGREGGVLKGLGGPDGGDRNPGVDDHVHERAQTLRSHNCVVAIAVVISGIVGIIRKRGGNQTKAEATEQQNGQQAGPQTRRPHDADDTPVNDNASQGIPAPVDSAA